MLEELESYQMTPEQEELLDKWIEAELALFQNTTTSGYRGLGWWQCCEAIKKLEMCVRHYYKHEQATWDECWIKYWRNTIDWKYKLHSISKIIKFEGKEYVLY
jgi:hypothetical protein